MSEKARIRLCPHCGGEARTNGQGYAGAYETRVRWNYSIYCVKCGASVGGSDIDSIVDKWNKRVPEVVRCGECEYVEKSMYTFPDGDTVTICKCGRINGVMTVDDYCSFGKREEQE